MEANNEALIYILPYSTRDGVLAELMLMSARGNSGENYTVASVECEPDADHYRESVEFIKSQGYDVTDPDRWHYFGLRSFAGTSAFCYSVDVTGIERVKPGFTDVEADKQSESALAGRTVRDALNEGDGVTLALFVQLFRFVFNLKDYSIIKIKPDVQQKGKKSDS